jgi:serine/threonine-protein kinase
LCALASKVDSFAGRRELFGYEVIGVLGEGADTVVYAACDPNDNQLYAIKYAVRRPGRDDRVFGRLENEHGVGRMLDHPGLRKSIALKKNTPNPQAPPSDVALVLELFDGVPLPNNMPTTMDGMINIFIQTVHAMQAMHKLNLIHCDMKPNNILIAPDKTIKVIDFGLACSSGTKKQRVQGTADFIAPEQAKCQPVTVRTDVFNVGATFYWVLTGRHWPTLLTVSSLPTSGNIGDPMAPPIALNRAVPQKLSNLVMDCVQFHAQRRPADMAALLDVLNSL